MGILRCTTRRTAWCRTSPIAWSFAYLGRLITVWRAKESKRPLKEATISIIVSFGSPNLWGILIHQVIYATNTRTIMRDTTTTTMVAVRVLKEVPWTFRAQRQNNCSEQR